MYGDEQGLAHQHQWRVRARVDQCHYEQIVKTCDGCQETQSSFEQRDFENGMGLAFARQDCAICRERLRGREPESWGVRT